MYWQFTVDMILGSVQDKATVEWCYFKWHYKHSDTRMMIDGYEIMTIILESQKVEKLQKANSQISKFLFTCIRVQCNNLKTHSFNYFIVSSIYRRETEDKISGAVTNLSHLREPRKLILNKNKIPFFVAAKKKQKKHTHTHTHVLSYITGEIQLIWTSTKIFNH